MANFTHVQFISWEVYAGPNRGPRPWPINRATSGLTIPDPPATTAPTSRHTSTRRQSFALKRRVLEKREVRFLC
jgi:hypothetical protein